MTKTPHATQYAQHDNIWHRDLDPSLQYSVQSPGTHIRNDTNRVYVKPNGSAYKYTLRNTPVQRGNWNLFQQLLRQRFSGAAPKLTVGDALSMQARDPHYIKKYKQHLQKQHNSGHQTYAGVWQFRPKMFDQIMGTPVQSITRWNTPQLAKIGPHYSPSSQQIHVADKDTSKYDTPYGVSYMSTRPVSSNSGAVFTGLRPGNKGAVLGHQLNHWIHYGGSTAIPHALLFGRDSYGQAGSPSGKLRYDLFQLNADDPDLVQAVDPYSQDAIQIMQMNSAYTRGKYALLQQLKKYPNSKAFKRFDPAKLQQIQKFPQFIDLDKGGLQQFRKQMQFWQQNPQLAQLLGNQAMRAAGSYNELRNAHQQLGAPVGSSHAQDADRRRIQKSLNIFQSYRHLGANDKKRVMDNLRSKYDTQYNESQTV